MKEIRITLDDMEYKEVLKKKRNRTWREYILDIKEPTEKELEKEFELRRKTK